MTRRALPFALAALIVALAAAPRVRAAESGDSLPPNMTTYFFGVLVKGPKWSPEDTPERAKIMEGHLAHLRAMNTAGKLVLAGPLLDDGDWRGILIYRTKSIEEAQRLADDDPAVKAGRLQVTMHPWLVQKGVLPDPLDGKAESPK
jgi:uncharacterized protein